MISCVSLRQFFSVPRQYGYSVGTEKKRLNETVLYSTHTICLTEQKRLWADKLFWNDLVKFKNLGHSTA